MLRQKKVRRIILAIIAFVGISTLFFVFHQLPSIKDLPNKLNSPSIRITDRNNILLYEIFAEDGSRHTVLNYEDLPVCIMEATIAIEDHNFYTNLGIDVEGIIRAAWINLQGKETIAGGSTITQQIARSLLLPDEMAERTIRRKLREIVLALQINHHYSKDEVLALYLNEMYYGGLAYGIEAASQTYFGKPADELNLAECTLIAGLPQAPSYYNPLQNPDAAKDRQEDVLDAMQTQGFITSQENEEAKKFPLAYNPAPYPILAPHFVQLVKNQLDQLAEGGQIDLRTSMIVRTTLDYNYQQEAERTITNNLAYYQSEGSLNKNVNNAALVAIAPQNGQVLALVGSADYFNANINGTINMAATPRQSGSAFKPFIYAAALDPTKPTQWTAATVIEDVTTTFVFDDGSTYTPHNYDLQEHGPVPVRKALGSSLNIPAILTLEQVGIDETINLAKQLGITSLEEASEYTLSLAVGSGMISLLELSNAYSVFANQGKFVPYQFILNIESPAGETLYQPEDVPPQEIFPSETAWLINDILSDDEARSTGFGRNSILNIDRPAAVKTGTTTNYYDNWTIGYTPDLIVGVWVGNANHLSMQYVNGLTGAGPIWHDFMREALKNAPIREFVRPDNMVAVEVCTFSGLLPTDFCKNTYTEWFISGTEPTETDDVYQLIWIDTSTNLLASANTPQENLASKVVLNLPVRVHNWARAQGYNLLADFRTEAEGEQPESEQLTIVYPHLHTTYQINHDYDQTSQEIMVEAVGQSMFDSVTLWIDNTPLATFSALPYLAWWPLEVGSHEIWAEGTTTSGETVTSEAIEIYVVEQPEE